MHNCLELNNIFSRFQNLNLLALINNLQKDHVSRGLWIRQADKEPSTMCPLAHGTYPLTVNIGDRCENAAQRLSLSLSTILRFIGQWDGEKLARFRLLFVLEDIWKERLEDAETLQEVLQSAGSVKERETQNRRIYQCVEKI